MHQPAISLIKLGKRNKPEKESFGWDVYNTDSVYKAYEKRINKIPKLMERTEDRLDMMAQEVEEVIEKRNQFSRKRIDDGS